MDSHSVGQPESREQASLSFPSLQFCLSGWCRLARQGRPFGLGARLRQVRPEDHLPELQQGLRRAWDRQRPASRRAGTNHRGERRHAALCSALTATHAPRGATCHDSVASPLRVVSYSQGPEWHQKRTSTLPSTAGQKRPSRGPSAHHCANSETAPRPPGPSPPSLDSAPPLNKKGLWALTVPRRGFPNCIPWDTGVPRDAATGPWTKSQLS